MKITNRLTVITAALFSVVFSSALLANTDTIKEPITVITFEKTDLNGTTLHKAAALPKEMVIAGSNNSWEKFMYIGQVGVGVWQSEPMKLKMDPQSIDEYIFVLAGEVTVTSATGAVNTFTPGDSFVLPAGFMGTWETTGLYRQLIVANPSFIE